MQHSAAAIFCCWFQHPLAGRLQWGLQNSCQGQRCKKSNAEAQVLYWVHVFSTDTCLTCWNIAFNKRSTHETACLQSPCLLISIHVFIQAFLIFVTAESYSCTQSSLEGIFTTEGSEKRQPLPSARSGISEWSAVRWFQPNGCLFKVDSHIFYTEFLISFCDSKSLNLFI